MRHSLQMEVLSLKETLRRRTRQQRAAHLDSKAVNERLNDRVPHPDQDCLDSSEAYASSQGMYMSTEPRSDGRTASAISTKQGCIDTHLWEKDSTGKVPLAPSPSECLSRRLV